MKDLLLFLIPLIVLVAVWVWERQLKKEPGPSFRPWQVRLRPKQKR